MTYRYRLVLAPDDNDTVLATSPDFPPLATFGEDAADARSQALEALLTLIGSMIDAGEAIPLPCWTGEGDYVALPLLATLKVELQNAMLASDISREALQRRMGLPDGAIDRLLRLSHNSRVQDMETAFRAIGRELSIEARSDALAV